MFYEYKVVPAPSKPRKASKVKGNEARFAHGLEALMNELAGEGWQYQRADILPSEERRGLRSAQTVYRSVLVFRRPVPEAPMAEFEIDEGEALEEDVTTAQQAPVFRHEEQTEASARFSLVGAANREDHSGAPPLSAPHVDGQEESRQELQFDKPEDHR